MVKSYCTYGMCNEDTAQTVNEGENLDRLTYWDGGKKVTVEDVHIISINKDTVTLELPDTEMILDIADIECWE